MGGSGLEGAAGGCGVLPECAPDDVPGWPLRVALRMGKFLVLRSWFVVGCWKSQWWRGRWHVVVIVSVPCAGRNCNGAMGRSPALLGEAARAAVSALATNRTRTRTRHRASRRACERDACTGSVNMGEWPADTAVRVDRRAATGLRRTTNEAFSARYLRACAVPHDGEKRRRSPRALPRACAVGVVGRLFKRKDSLKMRAQIMLISKGFRHQCVTLAVFQIRH